MSKKNSVINVISKEELLNVFNKSCSFKDILLNLGLDDCSGGNYRTLKKRLENEHVDLSGLDERRRETIKQKRQGLKYSFEEIFCKNSKCKSKIKNIIFNKSLMENRCCMCKTEPVWNGKQLTLQLDHINGDTCDNRIENLRLLCPNCHSQTETYCGKSRKSKIVADRINIDVLKDILTKNNIEDVLKIMKISRKQLKRIMLKNNIEYVKKNGFYEQQKKFEISREELQKLINKEPFEKIGRMFGVCGNSIKKRCKKLDIEMPSGRRGFWSKVYSNKTSIIAK
jgi:hypothetical protein